MRIGLDVGSTTLKCVVLDDSLNVRYQSYERHGARIAPMTAGLLEEIARRFPQEESAFISVSGSAGMGLATDCGLHFVQEVYATRTAVTRLVPDADVVVELGGEDAKILFLTGGLEVRMNGSCAGGTGSFIDQMASLLHVTPDEMNALAASHEKIYTIASRCGVFAKSDIQPLLNQGAGKPDLAASIFHAVVSQTIAGLAQGRELKGKVVYLGGPLTFLPALRQAFDETLGVQGICPEHSLYGVAIGAAMSTDAREVSLSKTVQAVATWQAKSGAHTREPLFRDQADYDAFRRRHARATVSQIAPESYSGEAYLGIDAGSTTVKAVVMDPKGRLLHSQYLPNNGNPVPLIRSFLTDFYTAWPAIRLAASAVTGYGEDIIRNAFRVDFGVVETIAHLTAARRFAPEVDFIIDIGGQDIKCFKIRNGAIDNIFLNEACSSGCGSFLQTFAGAMGHSVADFARFGLLAEKPVDLGSRCTVFMNSSVKQAQKDGADIGSISAGLSMSVVKNALYKVIRASSAEDLGRHVVVQGGTFLNDAVLRAFELEIGREVVRPEIAGLMGAYGAALYAQSHVPAPTGAFSSTLLQREDLDSFRHEVKAATCGLCGNHCRLTVNTFGDGRKYIGGNRCERPVSGPEHPDRLLNAYAFKRDLIAKYQEAGSASTTSPAKHRIGIPLGLNLYELLPFWHAFFTSLGFDVVTSPHSNRELYLAGQHTIPSDTVCYPAKLMHGHVESLVAQGVDTIFYPCMTYNLDEGLGDNHYNCPVVAYYPEVLAANMPALEKVRFIYDYLGLHRPADFVRKIHGILQDNFGRLPVRQVKSAAQRAYDEYAKFLDTLREEGRRIIETARRLGQPIVVLAGRPYHADPEISHGVDKLINSCGAAVVSEEMVSPLMKRMPTKVLNQWTYHSRLYAAAQYVCTQPDMHLVQLVSFGCGVDAITTDEVREILERAGRIYTQIKIDEIANLGAVRLRLRSLFAAVTEVGNRMMSGDPLQENDEALSGEIAVGTV